MPYFAVVKFVEQDKSRQIVLSTDIKDFKPKHADAIDDKVYDIQWQDPSKSFDGYFRGNVILLAASLPELKEKAKNVKLRLPGNFNSMYDIYGEKVLEVKSQRVARNSKRKSSETILPPKGPKLKPSEIAEKTRRARAKAVEATLTAVKSKLPIPSAKPSLSEKKLILSDWQSTSNGLDLNIEDEKMEQVSLFIETTDEFKVSKTAHAHDQPNITTDSDNEMQDTNAETVLKTSPKGESDDTQSDDDDVGKKDKGEDNAGKDDVDYDADDPKNESESEASDVSSSPSIGEILKENKRLTKRVQVMEGCKNELTEAKQEITVLKGTNSYMNNKFNQLRADYGKLKEQNSKLETKIKKMQDTIIKLSSGADDDGVLDRTLPVTPDDKRSNFNESPSSPPERKEMRKRLVFTPSAKSTPQTKSSTEVLNSSEAGSEELDMHHKNMKSSASPSGQEGKLHLSPAMRDICSRVKSDMKGESHLPVDENNRVIISSDLKINKKKWDMAIKTQKKDSLFIKKLAHAAYGSENLKARTLALQSKKFKNKKVATPSKIDSMTACYLARIQLNNPACNELKTIEEARTYISEKMQDEARERPKKNDA